MWTAGGAPLYTGVGNQQEVAMVSDGVGAEAIVNIDVFDVTGRLVRATTSRESAGAQRFGFDGRDHAGRMLPSGVYFYRVKANGETITRKMVIAR